MHDRSDIIRQTVKGIIFEWRLLFTPVFDVSISRLIAMTLDDNQCGNVQLVQQLLGIIEETITLTYMRTSK
jgi:hypothetical protein